MRLLTTTILALLPTGILASAVIAERDVPSACNPYTDWGHTQGTHSYFCANLDPNWPATDYHCVEYKSVDFCSNKIFCTYPSGPGCSANEICYYGICVQKVNAKQCQRTCS